MTATTRNQINLTDLTTRPQLLAAVLEAAARAVSALLNARFPHCPPLRWSADATPGLVTTLNGMVSVVCYPEQEAHPASVVARWAVVLGLGEPEYSANGTVSYQGFLDGLPVTVWAVTNRDLFYRRGERS